MKQEKGKVRILLFTGDGKGKTTAALGMALRASGHGLKTLILQFIKADPTTGEVAACRNLPLIQIVQSGLGFVPPPESPRFADHRRAAEEGLRQAARAMESGGHDLVILDEVCLAVSMGLLAEEEVLRAVRRAGPVRCVILTGRDAGPGLISLADTVTEMRPVRHGFEEGRPAEEGVEY